MDHIDVGSIQPSPKFDCPLTRCLSDFFFVIGLSDTLDRQMLEAKATREQIAEAIQGKVVAWGQWVGSCERVWK